MKEFTNRIIYKIDGDFMFKGIVIGLLVICTLLFLMAADCLPNTLPSDLLP